MRRIQLPKLSAASALWLAGRGAMALRIAGRGAMIIGSILIVVEQWHEAASKTGLGTSEFGQGPVGTILLAAILGGMASVLWCIAVHGSISVALAALSPLQEPHKPEIAPPTPKTSVANSTWQSPSSPEFKQLRLDLD